MHRKTTGSIIVLTLLTVLGIWGGFFNFSSSVLTEIKGPMIFRNDGLMGLLMTKTMVEGHWNPLGVEQTPFLGYPGTHHLYDYPINERLGYSIWWMFSQLTNNYKLVFNLSFFFGYLLCAFSFYWFCRKFKIERHFSVLAALFYTFLSYHYIRIEHVFLANYCIVPIMLYTVFRFTRGYYFQKLVENKFRILKFIGLHILFSITNVYYCLFYCFLLAFSFVYKWDRNYKEPWRLTVPALSIALLSFFLLLNLLPNKIFRLQNSANPSAVVRDAIGAEIYALKPANILLPNSAHSMYYPARLKQKYRSANVVEGFNESIGIIGVLGLFFTFMTYLKKKQSRTISKISRYIFALFALGISGGLGALLTNYFMIEFRAYNRISIFIATLALLSFFLLLNRRLKGLSFKTHITVSLFLFFIFVIDSFPKNMVISPVVQKIYQAEKVYFASVESLLSENDKILQLPYMPFPETPPIHQMLDYDPLIPYLVSTKKLYFSYGAIKGREAAQLIEQISANPINIDLIIQKGFGSILIDLNAYADDQKLEVVSDFIKLTGQQPVIGGWNNHFAFFKLKK